MIAVADGQQEGAEVARERMLSPLEHRTFRWLWMAFAASSLGTWMETLGGQWFVVSQPGGAKYVALVQTAITLPMALLALPGGVLADNLDRRRLLIAVQSGALLVMSLLTFMAWRDLLTVRWILALTVLVGVGNAITLTPFQSLVPDLVSRSEIPSAAALVAVGANLARVVGPAGAGVVITVAGVPAVFALSAATCALFLSVLLAWNGKVNRVSQRERFFPAVRSGVRYVRHSPQVLRLMLRAFWFTTGMMAVFALLPLLATQVLRLGSGGYGALVGCVGLGAVAGGLSTSRLRRRLSANAIIAVCFVVSATVIAVMPWVRMVSLAVALLAVAGWGWTLCLSTMAASMQLYLPAWVRARGLATYWMAMFGGQAFGSVVVGAAAARWGLGTAYLVSASTLALGATLAAWLPVIRFDHLDRTPSMHWPEPSLVVDPHQMGGEVVVQTVYWIDPECEEEFLRRMVGVRRVRLRTGGTAWRLLKDAETPLRFVEEYSVSSWQEHEYQLHSRLVASDRELEMLAAQLSSQVPSTVRLYRFDARG
ncbi:MFS transporter [Acidothermaceae bacterium B102]|nr:MFS transporter [Acidothermaceae bacterium B102]